MREYTITFTEEELAMIMHELQFNMDTATSEENFNLASSAMMKCYAGIEGYYE